MMIEALRELIRSPKRQREWLRVLMLPALLNSLIVFPIFLLVAIMASDAGADAAIRTSHLATLAIFVHTGSVFFGVLGWDSAPLLAAILVSLYTLGNVGVVVLFKSPEPLMSVIPWHDIGLSYDSPVRAALHFVASIILAIIVPILAAWRLFRDAFEMDAVDHSRPVELWDLKTINRRSTP